LLLLSLPSPCATQPKEIGLPFTAYTSVDEVREVRPAGGRRHHGQQQ
jgi:hypothetical protein